MKLAERKKIAHLMFLSLFDLIDEEKRSELNKWLKKRKENSANQEKFSEQGGLIAMQITSEKVYAYDLNFFGKTC